MELELPTIGNWTHCLTSFTKEPTTYNSPPSSHFATSPPTHQWRLPMTYYEATTKASALHPNWFCPLLRGSCNPQCICYQSPKVVNYYLGITTHKDKSLATISTELKEKYKNHWRIAGNDCINVMFFGQ